MEGAAPRDPDGPGFDALRGLVDALPAVIYEAEPGAEGRWRYVSAHIETLLGYSREEWIADPTLYVRSLHPDDREAVVRVEGRELEAARGGDVTAVTEHRMIRKDGSQVWVRDEARLTGEPGATAWQGVLIDITAERALTEAYDHYRSLVESLPGCLYRSEPGAVGRWKFLSPQIESLVGYSAGELMSDPRLRVGRVHPDDRDWVLASGERRAPRSREGSGSTSIGCTIAAGTRSGCAIAAWSAGRRTGRARSRGSSRTSRRPTRPREGTRPSQTCTG